MIIHEKSSSGKTFFIAHVLLYLYKIYINCILKRNFMKKLFLSVAIVAALAMASCQTKAEKAAEEAAAPEVTEFTTNLSKCANEADAKSLVAKAQDYVQQLVKEGKLDEAMDYVDKIIPTVKDKYPALASTLEAAKAQVKSAEEKLEAATEKADSLKEAAAEKADSLKEAAKEEAKEKAKEVAEAAKDKANDAVDAAKDKANDAVDAVKDKATDAAAKGADAIKNKLK